MSNLQDANIFEIIIMIGSYAALIMLVLGVPLFLLALLMGHMFEEKIERRPAVWCFAAPVVAWILVTAVFTVLRFAGLDFAALSMRFLGGLTDGEALSVLLGCIPPAAIFYWLTVSQPKP